MQLNEDDHCSTAISKPSVREMGRRRLVLWCLLLVFIVVSLKCLFNFHLYPADEDFTSLSTCPACFGINLCPRFFHRDITLIGGSKLKYFQFVNRKNVYYGKLEGERVVLKKLAHNWEIREKDRNLCALANLGASCDVSIAIRSLVSSEQEKNDSYFLNVLGKFNSTTDITRCPSERLLTFIYSKITSGDGSSDANVLSMDNVAEMMYGILLNPESVILQAFNQNEGWPFPKYRGSCGRVIVEEYVGPPLLYFENSNWLKRLDLSYQLLQIAEQLTDNSQGFALYLTDVSMDNFAVRPDGTLFLIDVESIVIVDRWKLRKDRKSEGNYLHRSKGEACKDCLNFSFEDLCSHDMSDHNYYAICKGLLVPHAYYSSKGLMHDIPSDVEKRTNLSSLLKECADPSTDMGRFIVVPKLLQIMKTLL